MGRRQTNETRLKISRSLIGRQRSQRITKICPKCDSQIICTINSKKKFCSRTCSTKFRNKNGLARQAGIKSAKSQNRRSKNEILFASLCSEHFSHVETNEQIFLGWDADVILTNEKIAILWNGIWHYKQISKRSSLKQIQNRDAIKIDVIKRCGYIPYVIKDLGSFNPGFVHSEFQKFLNWMRNQESHLEL